MTPEEIEKQKQEQEKKDAELAEALKAAKALQEEIKDLRKSRQEDRQALDALLKADKGEPEDADDVVEKAFRKREEESLKKARARTEARFKASKVEFNPSNDQGGLKYAAFEKELSKFKLDGIEDMDELTERLEEVYVYMNRNKRQEDENRNSDFARDAAAGSGAPKESGNSNHLTKVELTLIKNNNWSPDRYLKLKAKQPAYVNKLLKLLEN